MLYISVFLNVKVPLAQGKAPVHHCSAKLEGVSIWMGDLGKFRLGGAVASWLVLSTRDRVVRVRVLAGDIVLCSWARHFTLMVPLSTQVYKWVPANLMLGIILRWTDWTGIPSRGE